MEETNPPRIDAMPLYTNLDRIERGLAAQGVGPGDPIPSRSSSFALDQWHYHGTEAIAAAARRARPRAAKPRARHRRGRRWPGALSRPHDRLPRHRARAAAQLHAIGIDLTRRTGLSTADPFVRRRARRAIARRGIRCRRELARRDRRPGPRASCSRGSPGAARGRRLLCRRPLHAQAVRAASTGRTARRIVYAQSLSTAGGLRTRYATAGFSDMSPSPTSRRIGRPSPPSASPRGARTRRPTPGARGERLPGAGTLLHRDRAPL